jgi:hypothetical protein
MINHNTNPNSGSRWRSGCNILRGVVVNDQKREEMERKLRLIEFYFTEAFAHPEKFDQKETQRMLLQWNAMVERATDRAFFKWLEANVPDMLTTKGRPHWSESEKIGEQDKALLKEFEETLKRNVAANDGKKRRASQKTYADLADKHQGKRRADHDSVVDEYAIKQRVMRARRRQKALKETMQDILRIAERGKASDGNNTAEECERSREELLEALRRILRTR